MRKNARSVHKKSNGSYTLNIKRMFRDAVECQFRIEKDDNGKPTGNTPFTEIMFFIKNDLDDAFKSIEAIAMNHKRKSITTDDVIEYYGYVGRPRIECETHESS